MAEYIFTNRPDETPAHKTMLEYLSHFDPIEYKYRSAETAEKNISLSPEVRAKARVFEENHQFGSLSKQKYSYIAENLKLVYGDQDIIQNDINAYHLAEKRIIHQYLSIPQLDKMFDEDYFNFEWDMHVGQNFSEHHNDYYRDHFIHQIRDLYMMIVLLENFDFYNASRCILEKSNISKISNYTSKKKYEFMEHDLSPQRKLLSEISNLIYGDDANLEEKKRQYAEHFFYQYVIYASAMLSALFHDMGYPICHFLQVRHRISDYSPTMYMFTRNAFDAFDEISSKLGSSLLFTIVSSHEIKRSLSISEKGKYNHGAYSAIAFLLQFYNTGLIYTLPPEKQCAIELAAVAIYNHTAKFNVIAYDKNNSYYSAPFRHNPIAFLLRFCDDLQEWDRRYFEISESSDLMFCQECNVPILKTPENPDAKEESRYHCGCGNCNIMRPNIFMKRKLYLVTVSDSVHIFNEKEILKVRIDYNLYTLLMLSNINHTYAKHRIKELRGLEKLLSEQNYRFQSENELKFSKIELDYFVSANPLLIKIKILEGYLEAHLSLAQDEMDNANDKMDKLKKLLERLKRNPKQLRDWLFTDVKHSDHLSDHLIDNLFDTLSVGGHLAFYIKLLRECIFKTGNVFREYVKCYANENILYYEAMKELIADCKIYYEGREHHKRDKNENLYQQISVYTYSGNSFNWYTNNNTNNNGASKRKPYIGYFQDILLFYAMNLANRKSHMENPCLGNE